MRNLLFLVHRIPYPPNKGDKIRSYHFLKGLTQQYNIFLATFIDDPTDWKYVEKVRSLTDDALFVNIQPTLAKLKSLKGFIHGGSLTVPYYQNDQLQQWVDKTLVENQIEKIFVFSSAMARFIEAHKDLDTVIDFVDVDSDKWAQYAEKKSWPMNWVYQRESQKLLAFDKQAAEKAKMNIFVSQEEAKLFEALVNVNPDKISYVNNGVDTEYFNVSETYLPPYPDNCHPIVFTGAMDYWANVDAVTWFVHSVFPKIKQGDSEARFYIVGSNPTRDVLQLAEVDGVFVTGRVEDIRPYLYFSAVVVAPLKIARGIQNKVLEAMAMEKKIVATSQAMEGINMSNQKVCVEDDSEDFAKQVIALLKENSTRPFEPANREFVINNFSWDASLKRLTQIIN